MTYNILSARWRIANESAEFEPVQGFTDGILIVDHDPGTPAVHRAMIRVSFSNRSLAARLHQLPIMGKPIELEVEVEGPRGSFSHRLHPFKPKIQSMALGGTLEVLGRVPDGLD